MLDKDLAEIYGYDVKRLNEQVKRNINRFPEDFMFQLKASEITDSLKSQFATLNISENKRGIPWMHSRKTCIVYRISDRITVCDCINPRQRKCNNGRDDNI